MAALGQAHITTAAGNASTSATAIVSKLLTTAAATVIRVATERATATATDSTYATTTIKKLQHKHEHGASTRSATDTAYTTPATAAEEYFQLYEAHEVNSIVNSQSNNNNNNNNNDDIVDDVDDDDEDDLAFIEGISDWLTTNNNASLSKSIDSNAGIGRHNNDHSNSNESAANIIWHTLVGNQTNVTDTNLINATAGSSWRWHDDDINEDDIQTMESNGIGMFTLLHETNTSTDPSINSWPLASHAASTDADVDADDIIATAAAAAAAAAEAGNGTLVRYSVRFDDNAALSAAASTTTTISTAALNNDTGTTYYFRTFIGQLDEAATVANGEGNADVDIALIDSAESALDADTDYGLLSLNGGGGGGVGSGVGFGDDSVVGDAASGTQTSTSDLIQRSLAYNSENAYVMTHNKTPYGVESITDTGVGGGAGGGSTFMLLLEDFGEYFYNYNGSTVSGTANAATSIGGSANLTNYVENRTLCTNFTSNTTTTASCYDISEVDHNYWALILILFPILTLFGNILVILSVCRERSLQTVTNYFIVSLAIADLLVAVVVMPFAVYVLVNGIWALPNFVCDFYIAMDVICSTSSIFNLVAISIDRYIAVTQPIKYAKHKNSRRVCLTILLVWAISAAIGSPIVLGLNNTPNRDPDVCAFYNADFILYSSLSSFYIPCIIMVFLYWNIFKALRSRARKQRAARKPQLSELTGGSVIENIAQTRRLAETALDSSRHASRIMPDEPATNTASGSNEEDDENAVSPDIDDCHVIVNDKSTEFMLATVVEETGNVVAQITTQPQLVVADPNGNHDSGYAPSNVDDVLAGGAAVSSTTPPDSPLPSGATMQRSSVSSRRNTADESPKRGEPALSVAMKPLSFVRYGVQEAMTLARNDSTLSTTSKTSSRKDKKNSQASRFTIYKVHKASKKKREKSSAKKERKATKTLAIVLGVFLFCWLPFFSCNIMDAMCAKFNQDCRPGVTAYILTTWLGYINSFVNPVIYTIFNPEFRKAFKKIMHLG